MAPIIEFPKKKKEGEEEVEEVEKRDLEYIEKEVVKDLIFLFQGLDGKFLKFNENKKNFEFSSKRIEISKRIKNHLKKLFEIGFLIKKIQNFTTKQNKNFTSLTKQVKKKKLNH